MKKLHIKNNSIKQKIALIEKEAIKNRRKNKNFSLIKNIALLAAGAVIFFKYIKPNIDKTKSKKNDKI